MDGSELTAGPAQLVLTATVARRYYVDGRSKVEIADELEISRFKVARLLDHALATGLVRIEIGHPGSIRCRDSRQVGRHVGEHDVDGAAGEPGLERCEDGLLAKVAGDDVDAVDRLDRQEVERDNRAVQRPRRCRGIGGGRSATELAPHVLAPRARRGTEVDDELAGREQVQLLVELLQLVRGAGAIALALRELHVRIGEVLVQPGLVELLAFAARRHRAPIIVA